LFPLPRSQWPAPRQPLTRRDRRCFSEIETAPRGISTCPKAEHACKHRFQNSCKGKGGCKTGDNGCKGKNSCKGKGGCATDGCKGKNSCKGKGGCATDGSEGAESGRLAALFFLEGQTMPANRFNGFTDYGIGIGLRIPHYRHIFEKKPVVDWFEIISENFMVDGGRPLAVLDQILEQYRVVQHGVSMYFGSAEPLNREHLRV
jgi:hypothetical protein